MERVSYEVAKAIKGAGYPQEEWRPIIGYNNKYEVSNKGNVRCLNYKNTNEVKILTPYKTNRGYLRVDLYANGKSYHHSIHRLVAEAFILNPDNLPQVNHKDENPLNNHVNNLEWCTVSYNINYGNRNSKVSKILQETKDSIPIKQYTLNGEFVKEWKGAREIERILGYNQANIRHCCEKQGRYAKEFQWRYSSDTNGNEPIEPITIYNTIPQAKPVLQYDKQGNLIKEWKYCSMAARELGYDVSTIARCCRGDYQIAYGYVWKYKVS